MTTLYIDRKNASLRVSRRTLELRENDRLRQRIPFTLIERIVIVGNVHVETGALGALADAGIGIALLGGRRHSHRGMLLGPLGADGARRLAQYRARSSETATRAIACCLLQRKLAGQQRLLHKALAKRPDKRRPLKKASAELARLRERLRRPDLPVDALRGIEGAAAAAYFAAWGQLLPPGAGFQGRRRRPPPDPVNAALSLGYTLLYGEAVAAIHAAGLDPALGYLHEPAWGRASLAADLIEPLRPRHDENVWRLFAERRLTADHFDARDGGHWLGKAGRAIFFARYETHAAPARRWLRLFLNDLIHRLREERYDA